MSTIKLCDACGKGISPFNHTLISFPKEIVELCSDCSEQVEEYINELKRGETQ